MNWYNGFSPEQRTSALAWLSREYREGRRRRPTVCDGCGQTEGIIEAHSENYASPFGPHIGAYGLCYRCHMMVHCRAKAPAAWDRYREMIRSGRRALPLLTRNLGQIRRYLAGHDCDTVGCEPPVRMLLTDDGLATRIKTIWTACFGYARDLPASIPQVSIARWSPRWWSPPGGRLYCRALAPSAELFDRCRKGLLGPDEWQQPYRNQFQDPQILQDVYEQLTDGCCLLCWEAQWENCHRKEAWHLLHQRFGVQGGEYKLHAEQGTVQSADHPLLSIIESSPREAAVQRSGR